MGKVLLFWLFVWQTPTRFVPEHISRPEYAETGVAHSEREAKKAGVIQQLSPREIEGMRLAGRVSLMGGE